MDVHFVDVSAFLTIKSYVRLLLITIMTSFIFKRVKFVN